MSDKSINESNQGSEIYLDGESDDSYMNKCVSRAVTEAIKKVDEALIPYKDNIIYKIEKMEQGFEKFKEL